MGYFSSKEVKLLSRPVDLKEKPFVILEEFSYTTDAGMTIVVEKDYATDFASVPRFFHRVVSPVGRHGNAAIVHDVLCDESPHSVDYKKAADVFDEAMKDLGVGTFRRKLMKAAVLLGGPKFNKGDL